MANDDLLIRSMHDLGLGAWFGGSLMGAIGVNGAANEISDRKERARVAAAGWGRWTPVNAAAIGLHVVGGAALIATNRSRVAAHRGSRWNTIVKSGLTGAALAATAYSGLQGRQVAQAGSAPAEGGVLPAEDTPEKLASAQQRLRIVQWVIPALTGALIVLGAQQGEQQRPRNIAADAVARLTGHS